MTVQTRVITATWYDPDGLPAAGAPIAYRLIPGSFEANGFVPSGTIDDTADAAGITATVLWTNAEGQRKSEYVVTWPSGEESRFVLPAGDTPIALEELLTAALVPPWAPPVPTDVLDAAIAGVYDALANTSDVPAGDALVGAMVPAAAGAVPRTVHDKVYETVSLEDFGADPTGATDSRPAFDAALAYLASIGGGTLEGAGGWAQYFIDGDPLPAPVVNIKIPSNVTLDGRGASIWGPTGARFQADGTPDVDGDPDAVPPVPPQPRVAGVRNVHIRNWHIGGPDHADVNKMRGPDFVWAEDCSGEKIIVEGETGTAFHMFACWRVSYTSCHVTGGPPDVIAFGFLAHMTWDCVWTDCSVADGTRYVGFQQKGGENNVYTRCTVHNLNRGNFTTLYHAFWDRGDAPWKASNTLNTPLIYPWDDLGWGQPDPRRASHATSFVNCAVLDCPDSNGYCVQEALGTAIVDTLVRGTRGGAQLVGNDSTDDRRFTSSVVEPVAPGGTVLTLASAEQAAGFNKPNLTPPITTGTLIVVEVGPVTGGRRRRDVTAIAVPPPKDSAILQITPGVSLALEPGSEIFVPRGTVLTADAPSGATTLTVASTAGIVNGNEIAIIKNDQTPFLTTVNGTPGATTLPLRTALDGDASIGQEVSLSTIGQEADFSIVGGSFEDITYAAVNVTGQSLNYLSGAQIRGVRFKNIGRAAITATYAHTLRVESCAITDASATSSNDAIRLTSCTRPHVTTNFIESTFILRDGNGNPILDGNGKPQPIAKMLYAIHMLTGSGLGIDSPVFFGNEAVGLYVSGAYQVWVPGVFGNNSPADGTAVTTDANTSTVDWRCTIPTGQRVTIRAEIEGWQTNGGGNYASYVIEGSFLNTAGAVVQQGLTTVLRSLESDANWNAGFSALANVVNVFVKGAGSATVQWRVWAFTKQNV